MTTADGQGGITTSKGSIPTDSGEGAVKVNQPADGKALTASPSGGAPDRMTTADGQGGITATKGSVPADPGEGEVKVNQPADGTPINKTATISKRAANIRNLLVQANPERAAQFQTPAQQPVVTEKKADAPAGDAPLSDVSTETLIKIARCMLSTDEGIRITHHMLEKQAGEQAAREQISAAIAASQEHEANEQIKMAALDDLNFKFQSCYEALGQAGITESDADAIIKQASYHQEQISALEHPLEKAAYAQGMDDAGLMAAAEESAGEEGVPPVDEALPMGGENLSEEEIVQLLQEMVASGQITEEEIMQAMEGTEGGGAAAEAAPAPAAEAAPAPQG